MNRRLVLIIVVLGVAVALIAALATHGFGLLGGGRGPLTLYGNVDVREVDMAFRVPGRIASIPVEEGQRVRRGQLLATLDTATLDARIEEADAQVRQAEANLQKLQNGSRVQDIRQAEARVAAARAAAANAAQDYDRRRPLVAPGAISGDVWARTVSARDTTAAQLREAEAALSLAREGARSEDVGAAQAALAAARAARSAASTDVDDARLLAAVDGTIVTRAQEPGAIVQGGQTVMTLSIDRPLRIRAYVAESDLGRVAPGARVTVRADGNPKSYHGTIGYVAPRAEFTPKTVETEDLRTDLVYRLRIIVSDPDGQLRQGQPVTVTLAPASR